MLIDDRLGERVIEQLRSDTAFILYRAYRPEDARSLLVLVPRQPTMRGLEALELEYTLATNLDPELATVPVEQVRHRENMMLLLDDPGGAPLPRLLGRQLDQSRRMQLAVAMTKTVSRLYTSGLLHRDIKPENFLVAEPDSVRLMGFGKARTPLSSTMIRHVDRPQKFRDPCRR